MTSQNALKTRVSVSWPPTTQTSSLVEDMLLSCSHRHMGKLPYAMDRLLADFIQTTYTWAHSDNIIILQNVPA